MTDDHASVPADSSNPPAAPAASGLGSLASARLNDDLAAAEEAIRDRLAKAGAQKEVRHLSIAERAKRGRIAAAQTEHDELGPWVPPANRTDPITSLQSQETSRVPELVPVRHARMATSAFAFYRGAALVMASDLAGMPRSGLDAQLCGDAHLSNFGLFAAPDRSVIFDVNDFDETNPGPFEWDVKRLATSFVLAARDNNLAPDAGPAAAAAACAAYRFSMAQFATKTELDIWYDRIDASGLLAAIDEQSQLDVKSKGKSKAKAAVKAADRARQRIDKVTAKARSRDAWSAIEKITEVVDGRRQFRNQPPLLTRLQVGADFDALVKSLFREYRSTLQDDRQELLKRYEIIDLGHKVVGVGSVGLLAFVLLMRGRDDDDLMVLQIKQAQESVLEAFTRKSGFTKHGHRVVTGQRLMQAASDSFLGWIDGPGGRSFYVRQLRDMKWSPDPAALIGEKLARYALLCGHTLARAHARSGDAIAISAYLGSGDSFDKAVTEFSTSYADQAERDYAAFTEAIADGRLVAYESADDESARVTARITGSAAKKKPSRKRP